MLHSAKEHMVYNDVGQPCSKWSTTAVPIGIRCSKGLPRVLSTITHTSYIYAPWYPISISIIDNHNGTICMQCSNSVSLSAKDEKRREMHEIEQTIKTARNTILTHQDHVRAIQPQMATTASLCLIYPIHHQDSVGIPWNARHPHRRKNGL